MSAPFDDDADIVTALHYDEIGVAAELATWCGGELTPGSDGAAPTVWVPTAKGPRPAGLGDWIVRRNAGDYYTCDETTFAALHDPLT